MKKYLLLPVAVFLYYCSVVVARQEPISRKTIPIVAWAGIPAPETNLMRFQELREMGITVCLNTYPDFESMRKALDLALEAGLKMVTACPELKSDTETTVKKVWNHPALAGYFLKDEPVRKDFPELGDLARKIAAIDNRHFGFVNLIACIHPTLTEALGTSGYADYVKTFIREVPVPLLSFDFYPILKDAVHERWYEGLEIFSSQARREQKPFWGFALASSYNELHPLPTAAALRLQMYSNLAYGAQGLEYWTYWMTSGLRGAPIGITGKRTVIYDRIKAVNQEIQSVADVFAESKLISVHHTGRIIPRGTSRLEKLPWAVNVLETDGIGALVSVLENGDQSFLVIVNRDLNHSLTLIIQGDESLNKILKDGSAIKASMYENRTEIEPGDISIYRFPSKSPTQ